VFVVLGCLLAQPRLLAAQSATEPAALDSREYKELIRQALQHYTVGHWVEARVFFVQAHELVPNARTLRGLSLVCYESRHYVEAIAYAEQSLANPVQPLGAQMKAELQQLVDQARSFVTRARIVTKPATAELRIDGQSVAPDAQGFVLFDPGAHELAVEAPGYDLRTVQVRADGSELRFDIVLPPKPPEIVVNTGHDTEPASSGESGAVAPWIVVGVSAAVTVTGAVLFALGESDRAAVRHAQSPTMWADISGAYDRAPTQLAWGGALLGVGLAGITTGLIWKFSLEPRSERARVTRLRVTPTGMQLSGTF
jgi:hypothetical protein